jgi:hypothetical protein
MARPMKRMSSEACFGLVMVQASGSGGRSVARSASR